MDKRPMAIGAVYLVGFSVASWLAYHGRTLAAWLVCMLAFTVGGIVAKLGDAEETEEE